ncbi:MAG: hypothetical protein WC497_05160 [Patescibacteria group bacterium]
MKTVFIIFLALTVAAALAAVYFIAVPIDGTCNTCPDCFIDGWSPGSIVAVQLDCPNQLIGAGADLPGLPITSNILPVDLIAFAIVSGLAAWLFRPRKNKVPTHQ